MKVFKVQHKPTGLYFTPSKGYGNLSLNGKIYPRKPLESWYGSSVRIVLKKWKSERLNKKERAIIEHFNITPNERGDYWVDKYFDVPKEDWEIIEI